MHDVVNGHMPVFLRWPAAAVLEWPNPDAKAARPRTYDMLMGLLDPTLVKFQFQMSTISQGLVAHEYFTKYPGRFFSMHLQDVDLNATPPPGGTGGVQVAIGTGSIDWVKTFTTAKAGGVKNYFVEQNMELTRASVAALKAMTV